MACHSDQIVKDKNSGRNLSIALAGNANVGKSVLFNQLTGSSQIIGNWPGKTVEKAEGTLTFEGQKIVVVDLPGIYSFSTFGMEELVSREYIATENPDAVINVVDAGVLERNLFFTMQLIELEAPIVVCLNQIDEAKKKGITINHKKLEHLLGVPVVPAVAIRGEGIYELTKTAVDVAKKCPNRKSHLRYGDEIEQRIGKLDQTIQNAKLNLKYPSRWVAIKLLEGDPEIKKLVASSDIVNQAAKALADEISAIHNEPAFAVIASERYSLANKIANESQHQAEIRTSISDRIEWLTTHRVFGYVISAAVIVGLLIWTFSIGSLLSGLFAKGLSFFAPVDPALSGTWQGILWSGIWGGVVAGLTLIIPFVVPFYLMLAMIEDSGILTRVAFMLDSAMHKIGLHGKALIPLILGFGCNVPAIQACRIMETKRERLLATFAITFAPCSARTIVILGLVAVFLGPWWALSLYGLDIALIFVLGKIALKVVPGQSTGLIMEMSSFKVPSMKVVARQTWARTKSLIYIVFPLYIAGSVIVQALFAVGALQQVGVLMAPVTVLWLGLPAIAGVLLILGFVRKEMVVLAAVAIFSTTNLALYFSNVQLYVLGLVNMIYIPCLSTVAIIAKDYGWKTAIIISLANFAVALLVGGIALRLLTPFL